RGSTAAAPHGAIQPRSPLDASAGAPSHADQRARAPTGRSRRPVTHIQVTVKRSHLVVIKRREGGDSTRMTLQDVTTPHTQPKNISVTLVAEGLGYAWGSRRVLRAVDLALEAGTVTALRGANGSGKTTLVRLLAGGLEPQAGRVRLGDVDAMGERSAYA